jgi:DNA-binding NarL/FixJ family response regulator
VLRLVAAGKENREIAEELTISEPTVKNHVSSILAKLEVDNRIQAAVYAVRNGLA